MKTENICQDPRCGHDYQHYHKFNTDEQCSHWERRANESSNVVYCPCKKFKPKNIEQEKETWYEKKWGKKFVPQNQLTQKDMKALDTQNQARHGVSLHTKKLEDSGKTPSAENNYSPKAKPKVFIERAVPLTPEGIRAICGTDEEYNNFVDKLVKGKTVKSNHSVGSKPEDVVAGAFDNQGKTQGEK